MTEPRPEIDVNGTLVGFLGRDIRQITDAERAHIEAEATKLLENTFRAVNIGLVNEIAMMSRKLGIDPFGAGGPRERRRVAARSRAIVSVFPPAGNGDLPATTRSGTGGVAAGISAGGMAFSSADAGAGNSGCLTASVGTSASLVGAADSVVGGDDDDDAGED